MIEFFRKIILMATTAFKNATQKASTKGVLLLEIDLIGNGSTYDTSKTCLLYTSDAADE